MHECMCLGGWKQTYTRSSLVEAFSRYMPRRTDAYEMAWASEPAANKMRFKQAAG